MEKLLRTFKFIGVFFVVLVFCLSLLVFPAVKNLSAAGNGIKVFIDPGHGGKDPGAVWNGLQEKDANLAIAVKLKAKLEAAGFTVIMRRTGDQYHTLDQIVNMANSSGADIFISIHNNASISTAAHGTETYWCPNGVNGSSQLANLVQSRLLSQIGRANRGVKTANFRVIKYTTMPAALVECAFVSNPTEAALLKTASFQEKCAVGLFNAINEFSKGVNKTTGSYTGGSGNNSAGFSVIVDYPTNNTTITKEFLISGWAADLSNIPPKKLAKVEIYKGTERNEDNLLGTASRFERPDLGRSDILDSGYMLRVYLDKLVKGENILGVYAYDSNGNYSYNMVKINVVKEEAPVEQPNSTPIANPGGPYEGTVGQEITFDGSASADSDGSITEYIWDFGDGSSGSGVNPVYTYSEAGTYMVKLTVKDDKNAQSASVQVNATISDSETDEEEEEEEEEDTQDDENPAVSNSTSVVGYREVTADQLVRLFTNRDSDKVEQATVLAELYIQYGELFNIRADIAWAQMCHETGFLEYTGDVKPEQNNFCGMGAVAAGVSGNSFATEELGVIAHLAHLAWYYYPDHVNEYCSSQYDPRHFDNSHYRYTGDTTLGFLNGRWAPGATYTDKIVLFSNEIWQGSDNETETSDYIVTAEAGQNLSANVGEELTFDASSSVISPLSQAGTVTYKWDWDNDSEYDVTTEDLTVKHIFNDAGEYEVKLKVAAFDDIESTDTLTVNINDYPVANPGGPYEGTAGQEITFDGSASSDSDGQITEYIWDFGDGEIGSGVSPVHTYSEAGTYTLSLEVKDNSGATSIPEYTEVVIAEEPEQSDESDDSGESEDGNDEDSDDENSGGTTENELPTASAGGPYEGTAGQEITFDGSASSDSDGQITEYIWDFGDGEIGSGVGPVHTYSEAGTYTVKLTVKDDKDAQSASVQVSVVISEAQTEEEEEEKQQEIISRAVGKHSSTFTMVVDYPKYNTNITGDFLISGWAADLNNIPPRKLARVEIYNGPGRYEHNFLGTARIFERPDLGRKDILNSGYILRISVDSLSEGENILWIYAYDANNYYRSTSVKINVITEESVKSSSDEEDNENSDEDTGDGTTENKAPTASAGGPYEGTAGQEITFDGSASSDSDGSITEYIWDFGDGSSGSGVKPAHSYVKAGTYTASLKVKDNNGQVSDAVTAGVTVKEAEKVYPANTSPITNSTSMIGYTEVTVDQLVKIFVDRGSNKVEWARRIASIYIKYGKLFNIRADIAWAMMCHETGFLEYTGDVKPEQNNFCGMGAVGGGVPGNSFATEELGVIAHYAHLAWYYYPDHVNVYCSVTYDPRHSSKHYKYTGDTTLGFLNGRWAPGATYTGKIILFANKIYGF